MASRREVEYFEDGKTAKRVLWDDREGGVVLNNIEQRLSEVEHTLERCGIMAGIWTAIIIVSVVSYVAIRLWVS